VKSSLKMSPLDDRDLAGDTRALGVALCERRELAIVFDSDGLRAELLRRGNRQPAVAGAQVVDDVGARRPRHRQHPLDHGVRRRQPHDVLAGLPQPGLIQLVAVAGEVLRTERSGEAEDEESVALRLTGGSLNYLRASHSGVRPWGGPAAHWTTFVLRTPVFALGAARRAHWTTFVLRTPVFALGAARRAHGRYPPPLT
jgi:hypothetical protein